MRPLRRNLSDHRFTSAHSAETEGCVHTRAQLKDALDEEEEEEEQEIVRTATCSGEQSKRSFVSH